MNIIQPTFYEKIGNSYIVTPYVLRWLMNVDPIEIYRIH